jgi:uncharacterized protein YggL (DUF469 family)
VPPGLIAEVLRAEVILLPSRPRRERTKIDLTNLDSSQFSVEFHLKRNAAHQGFVHFRE